MYISFECSFFFYGSVVLLIQWTLKIEPASLTAQLIKNPSAVQETPIAFLGREDLLEEG